MKIQNIVKYSAISVVMITGLIAVLFFNYPVSHNATFKNDEIITLFIYQSGVIKNKIEFPPNSKEHAILNNWLSSNSAGWSHDINSYTPSFYISSKGISINLKNGFSVINYAQYSKDRHTQIIKNMDNSRIIKELIEIDI
ncbi:hypothetical protein [Pseudoalteromonas sp. T1lg88]|uniref:hypothetical protein n=1 Tax=Pseudoalteromonas sp. T1lg88 TaxID=2077104 RepID=UPI000CF6C5A0|nr:hypothetical protein [Pseudoalteromonas sp. T1lg88]